MIGNQIASLYGIPYIAPTGNFESIATITAAGSSSVTFSSIPSTYKHLQIRGMANNGETSSWNNQGMQINGITSAVYSFHVLYGDGASVGAIPGYSNTKINDAFRIPPASTGVFGVVIMDFLDYTNTNKYKTIRTLDGGDGNGNGWISLASGLYQQTTAISSITLISSSGNFGTGSQFALYGIKGA